MERNFILGAVVVGALVLVAATALRKIDVSDAGASGADPTATSVESGTGSSPISNAGRTERRLSSPIDDRRDDTLLSHVEHKYRYLLADVESAHVEELKRRLLEREGEANIARKERTDARVSEMLSPREREYYDSLKDSDLEQHHVAEYVGGVGNVAPLDERQEREILDAKLRQKQRYAAALREAGLDGDAFSQTEREYAQTQVTEVLEDHLDSFLMEVSPTLTPEQHRLLRNYETTEFERERDRMQERINAK